MTRLAYAYFGVERGPPIAVYDRKRYTRGLCPARLSALRPEPRAGAPMAMILKAVGLKPAGLAQPGDDTGGAFGSCAAVRTSSQQGGPPRAEVHARWTNCLPQGSAALCIGESVRWELFPLCFQCHG